MRVHIALVGGQPLPVFRVVQDQHPDEVIFLHSAQTLQEAHDIQYVSGVKARYIALAPVNIETIEEAIEQIKEEVISNPSNNYSIDITGGTKLWTILLYRAFVNLEHVDLFYIDQNNRIFDLKSGRVRPAKVHIDIEQTFSLSGATIDSWLPFSYLSDKDTYMARQIWQLHKIIPNDVFITLISNAPWLRIDDKQSLVMNQYKVEWDEKTGMIILSKSGHILHPPLKSNYIFDMAKSNGWYEFLVADLLNKWPQAREVWINAVITSRTSGLTPVDEVDVIVRTDNRLVFVECKTGNISSKEIAAVVEKSKRYGGISTISLLVTLKPLSPKLVDVCREGNVLYFNLPSYDRKKKESDIQEELYEIIDNHLDKINRK